MKAINLRRQEPLGREHRADATGPVRERQAVQGPGPGAGRQVVRKVEAVRPRSGAAPTKPGARAGPARGVLAEGAGGAVERIGGRLLAEQPVARSDEIFRVGPARTEAKNTGAVEGHGSLRCPARDRMARAG